MVLDKISDLATGFEGCEKKLEVEVSGGASLRVIIPRPSWDNILKHAKCSILSVERHKTFDAYILSESSLFVWDDKLMIKTCGTTELLRCLPQMCAALEKVRGAALAALRYSRSNFMFPNKQPFLYRDFGHEVSFLDGFLACREDAASGALSSKAYILGPLNGRRWHVYSASFARLRGAARNRKTLEIIMFDLDQERMAPFYREKLKAQARRAGASAASLSDLSSRVSGISEIFGGAELTSRVNAHLFEPCGYSCNGVVASAKTSESYFTIHVTPEPECSFVSFETDFVAGSYENLLRKVLSLFRPSQFCCLIRARPDAKASKDLRSIDLSTDFHLQDLSSAIDGPFVYSCASFQGSMSAPSPLFGSQQRRVGQKAPDLRLLPPGGLDICRSNVETGATAIPVVQSPAAAGSLDTVETTCKESAGIARFAFGLGMAGATCYIVGAAAKILSKW